MNIRTERYQLPGETYEAYRKRMSALGHAITEYDMMPTAVDIASSLFAVEVATGMFDSSPSFDTSSSSDFSGGGGDFGGGGSDGSF